MAEEEKEFERHLPGNRNIYPIDPKVDNNPLAHLSRWDLLVKRESVEHIEDFEKNLKFEAILEEKLGFKMVRVKSKRGFSFVIRIFDTFGDLNVFDNVYKEFLFVRETELIEYDGIYYCNKKQRVYITQPQYSETLRTQIKEKSICFENEKEIKLFAADILQQIWIIHRCGYINGCIEPQNIIKREFNDNNKYVEDGWKLNHFSLHKYKSKGEYVGVPGWSSPELIIDSQKNKYLYSNDIFSFGLLLLYVINNGYQPLEITQKERAEYGQNENLIFEHDDDQQKQQKMVEMERKFKHDLRKKMNMKWFYEKLLKADHMIKNHLIQLYTNNKISLDLFHLLHDGILVFEPEKRWNCKQIFQSAWFEGIRQLENKKKVHKLRIKV